MELIMKIKSKNKINLKKPCIVYDIEVGHESHNFLLKCGVFVHNCCPGPVCHSGNLASGSSTVYVNGLQCGRIGDPVDCGSVVAQGSGNVFAGG